MDLQAVSAQIQQIDANIEGHTRWILSSAAACPPGGNRTWDQVLAHYGASPDDALTRLEQAQQAGQSRGATLKEVRRALEAMLVSAKRELDRVVPPVPIGAGGLVSAVGAGTSDPSFEHYVASLRAKLTRIPDEALARYTSDVCPPKAAVAASVNSVFANAQATAKLTPWANVKIDAAKVFECHACGAPQEVALDFVCRYCKSPMVKTPMGGRP
jgi:hypothetical protein